METIKNIVAGVYVLLQGGMGRLSQAELDWNDVLEVGDDVMRGFIHDAKMGHREHRTVTSDITLQLDPQGIDYFVTVPNVPDFELTGLSYSIGAGALSGWGEATLVDLSALSQYWQHRDVFAATYGSTYIPDGLKLRLNLLDSDVSTRLWRGTYRLPLFTELQMGDRPPLSTEFMRMVKLAWTIACVPLVKVPTSKLVMWNTWKRDTIGQYAAELMGWNNPNDPVNPGRWQQYLNGGVNSTTQPAIRFDSHRRFGGGSVRGVNGPGGSWGTRN